MMRPRVVLASASPRRQELLNLVGIGTTCCRRTSTSRISTVKRHASMPSDWPAAKQAPPMRPTRWSSAATRSSSSTATCSAKPRDRQHAAEMLRRLSGRSHVVMTGVAVQWQGRLASGLEETGVTFAR
jgi:septum formation protein